MSQNKNPEGSVNCGWVESAGATRLVMDEVNEVDGHCVGMSRYVGSNSFSLCKGESWDITHEIDGEGHELVELVLRQTVLSHQEKLPLVVPLHLILDAA